MYNFPSLLKQLRLNKGLSLKSLSIATNISIYRLCNWEKGKSQPTSKFLVILATFFNVKLDYLLGLVENNI